MNKVQELVEMKSVKDDLKDMTVKHDQLLKIIKNIHEHLPSYVEAYDSEVQAHKKLAHVKDLSRVNEIREVSLERDKLYDEVKHMKEIHSILTFSLTTAEQSLNESQPHVVQKLQEGRGKRLKVLERAHKERRKDLDQRSSQTITITSEHLEGFSAKAEKRKTEAESK